MRNMTLEEQETFVHWDYYERRVYFYTTRDSVFQQFLKKTANVEGREVKEAEGTISIPLEAARKPNSVVMLKRKAK